MLYEVNFPKPNIDYAYLCVVRRGIESTRNFHYSTLLDEGGRHISFIETTLHKGSLDN